MADKQPEKEPSYGQIMTNLLIPKDSRTNPRRILSGIAFVAIVAFFLFAAMGRSCQQGQPTGNQTGALGATAEYRIG